MAADDLDSQSGSTYSLEFDCVGPITDWPVDDGDEEEKGFTRYVLYETAKLPKSCLCSELRRKSGRHFPAATLARTLPLH